MVNYLWRVTAKRNATPKVVSGMSVEIVISNSNRKPSQKEIIEAINMKYGEGTALGGISLSYFDIVKV